ncbi:MAG: hypothetical protein WCO44_09125 [Bacteroidota bacterium]
MKTRIFLTVVFGSVLFIGAGFAQNQAVSEWAVDQNSSFLFGRILFSEKSDTVIFLDRVKFHDARVDIDSVDRIVYNRRTRTLTAVSGEKGKVRLGKEMELVTASPLNSKEDLTKVKVIEYTLGKKSVYVH